MARQKPDWFDTLAPDWDEETLAPEDQTRAQTFADQQRALLADETDPFRRNTGCWTSNTCQGYTNTGTLQMHYHTKGEQNV